MQMIPGTFSATTQRGLISPTSLENSGHKYLSSDFPFCFPATLKG
jgi:hypothetical protein